ncbi:putative non-specific serine/threonine protein kinase [Helianthus annuus]|nr:putative non-specific serine/threonine protein kinase [Helianthus annuus]
MNTLWLYTTIILTTFSLKAHSNPTCNPNDSMTLKHFMNGMESPIPGWTSNSSNCCNWDGVTCDLSGNVIKLELSKKKLVGTLVNSFTNLTNLRTLNLSRNLLKGTPPVAIFHSQCLQVLDLSANEFSGSLPDSVNLPMIQLLDISDNNFEGPIAVGFCINSTGIKVLRLGVNYFDGEVPLEFENCSVLEELSLDGNFVSGMLPEYLFRLPRLLRLTVQDNAISGQLRNSEVSSLVYLDVSLNYISGRLPDFFHLFPNLSYFAAHSNNLDGRMPFSLVNSRSISSVVLRNNSFSGLIDLNCSAMVNLKLLDLVDNKFTGSIPNNLPACPLLKTIDLGGNNLTGQIPETFKSFNSLCYLSLSMCNLNNLSGSLQILHTCPNLTTLVLSRSFDNEEMPSDANLQFKKLKTLVIPSCKLTGRIPVWLNGLTKLRILDLSWNELTGSIPPFLGSLQSLVYLDLSNNYLSGEIPKSLTGLPDLQFHDNSLELSVEFPISMRRGTNGKAFKYSYGIRFPPTLDLSNNFLTGPVWPEFGNLINLHCLNLRYNELSGNIPSSLGNLTSIETLDLSHNDLTGEIPLSLVSLGMLRKFSIAYNNLTGIIPSGGQFSTFSVSSFEGNPGLCGEFVLSCVKKQKSFQIREYEVIEESLISLPVWTGFGTGFLFAVILLLVLPRIRDKQDTDKFE